MRIRGWFVWLAAAGMIVAMCGRAVGEGARDDAAQHAGAEHESGGGKVELAFRKRPHVVLHAWARAAIEGGAGGQAPVAGFDELVDAGKALQDALGDERLWGIIDARIVGAEDAGAAVRAFEAMPAQMRMRSGASASFRDQAVAYAQKLGEVTLAFESHDWADTRAKLDGAADDIQGMLARSHPDAMAWIIEKIGWRVPQEGIKVPVDLVWDAPSPGGVTFRVPGGAACMVGVGEVEGAMRAEVVLHEAMHAVDVTMDALGDQAGAHDDALSRLRAALTKRGIDPRSKAAHDAWHTLFFVTAGEAVRRCIDPAYVDYGVTRGYDARVGPIAEVGRREWGAYLDGTQTMDEAIEGIVKSVE